MEQTKISTSTQDKDEFKPSAKYLNMTKEEFMGVCPIPTEFLGLVDLPKGIKRNDLCPCGSKKKFKKCCMPAYQEQRIDIAERYRERMWLEIQKYKRKQLAKGFSNFRMPEKVEETEEEDDEIEEGWDTP